MSDAERPLAVGLVGHRSFIARALTRALFKDRRMVSVYTKDMLGREDMSGLDCLYLVLGRERPTAEEAAAELDQVSAYVAYPRRRAKRVVYLSSRLAIESMPHKLEAERLISMVGGLSVRPPAVFGSGQRRDSEMLIPSLVRTGGEVELRYPSLQSSFVHVDHLARYLAWLADYANYHRAHATPIGSNLELAETIRISPAQLRELYLAFRDLSGVGPGSCA